MAAFAEYPDEPYAQGSASAAVPHRVVPGRVVFGAGEQLLDDGREPLDELFGVKSPSPDFRGAVRSYW